MIRRGALRFSSILLVVCSTIVLLNNQQCHSGAARTEKEGPDTTLVVCRAMLGITTTSDWTRIYFLDGVRIALTVTLVMPVLLSKTSIFDVCCGLRT